MLATAAPRAMTVCNQAPRVPGTAPRHPAARRSPASSSRALASLESMSLADIEADNARLKAELEQLDFVADAAFSALRAENDQLRKLAFSKVKRQPAKLRQSFTRRYKRIAAAGQQEGLHLPMLPPELLCLSTVTEEAATATTLEPLPTDPTPAAALAPPEAAVTIPQGVATTPEEVAIPTELPEVAPEEEEDAPLKAEATAVLPTATPEAATAAIPEATVAPAAKAAEAANKEDEGDPDWWRYPSGTTEVHVKKGEDDSLTFVFGAIGSLFKKITGS